VLVIVRRPVVVTAREIRMRVILVPRMAFMCVVRVRRAWMLATRAPMGMLMTVLMIVNMAMDMAVTCPSVAMLVLMGVAVHMLMSVLVRGLVVLGSSHFRLPCFGLR
jgi:hypothetical protein